MFGWISNHWFKWNQLYYRVYRLNNAKWLEKKIKEEEVCNSNSNKISAALYFSQHASLGGEHSRKSLHITWSSAVTWHCGWKQSFVHLLSSSSGVIYLSFLSPPVVWDATYLPHCQEKTTTLGHVSEAMAKTCFTVTKPPVNNLSGSQWMSLSSSRNDTITASPNKPPANI